LLSNEKFIALVTAHGVKPGFKVSKTTGQVTYATARTDAWMQELLKHKDPHIRVLAEARVRVKSTINETRAARFLQAGERSKLPFGISYWAAHTGRWGGMNKMNLQNLERDGELRKSILPPLGYKIVKGDSSQVEARFTAWLADQLDLVEGFKLQTPESPFDVYTKFASQIFGTLISKGNKLERFIGKTSILGLGFGMGPERFQDTLAKANPPVSLEIAECVRIVNIYRKVNNMIVKLWKKMDRILSDMYVGREGSYKCISWGKEHIRLPNGTFLKYADLHRDILNQFVYKSGRGYKNIHSCVLLENIIQALARIAVSEQMLEIDKKYRVVGMEHDAVVSLAKIKDADRAKKFVLNCMTVPPSWAPDLPISAEVKYAEHFL
jgi:DNA polymerase bacteriophage-type